jgi:hypothetical protein
LDLVLFLEIGGAVLVFVAMAAVYVFMIRGVRGADDKKSFPGRLLRGIAGDRDGSEFVSGLLAVLCLATLGAATGGEVSSGAAGAGLAVVAFACRLAPTWPMVKLPVHAGYSVLGILGALAAAKDYLFPPDPALVANPWLRWALLVMVWVFFTITTLAGVARIAAGQPDFKWKFGLILFASTEVVVYMSVPLGMSDSLNPLLVIAVLVGAALIGILGTMFARLVEPAAAAAMTLGSVVLTAGEAGITSAAGYLQLTSSMFTMIVTFLVIYALLRLVSKRWIKAPLMGKKS